jgi:flagellar hook-associated protein 3 FlgL
MRLTESMRLGGMTATGTRAAEQLYAASQRASTGIKTAVPSDGPAAYSNITAYDGTIARLSNRADLVGRAADTLDIADGALQKATDIVSHARELAVAMANADVDPAARARAAAEVTQLSDELIGLANTRSATGYMFAGTANNAPPFTAAGAFVGNDLPIQVETSDGVLARANPSGAKAFTAAGGRDVFQDLASFAQALASNNLSGIQTSIGDLDTAGSQIISARAEVGVATARLRSAAAMTSSTLTTLKGTRARDAEADPVEIYSALAQAKSTYERSMQVTAQVLSITAFSR